jgi:cytoskeleton protein RodZ
MNEDRPSGVGGRLQRAREERGLSLSQIAASTKIARTSLEAIERDDVKRLPGGIYTRAFVKAYAEAVGLDPERTLDEFLQQAPEIAEETGALRRPTPTVPAPAGPAAFPVFEILRVGVALSLPVLLVVLYVVLRPDPREPGPMFDRRPLNGGRVDAVAVDTPAPGSVLPASAQSGEDEPQPALVTEAGLTVVLTPRREVWLSATLDGKPTVARLLPAGEEETLEASREIVLKLGDAGAVSITINGEPIRMLGQPGQVVTARIAPDTVDQYLVNP